MSETKTETKIAPKKAGAMKYKHETLQEALAAFQANMPEVKLDASNPHFKSKFASLANLSKIALPKLSEQGLTFSVGSFVDNGIVILDAHLIHESGTSRSMQFPTTETNPQKLGSFISYMRRYSLASLTGLVASEDDDGHAASEAPRPQPRAVQQVKTAAPSGQSDELKELTSKIRAWASGDEERRKKANETHTRLKENLSGVKLQQAIIKELGIE